MNNKSVRKGTKVRYIGEDELAKGKTFNVRHKSYNRVEVLWPVRYLDGSVHGQVCLNSIYQ